MHIESRPSKQDETNYDFFVACDDTKGGLDGAIVDLRNNAKTLHVLSREKDTVDTGEYTI